MTVHLLDAVCLAHQAGDWPAGTEGTVVALHADTAIVEVAEGELSADGLPLRDLLEDLIDAPVSNLSVIKDG